MSYDKNLFHRMVEELDRMAEDEVELNCDDIAAAIMAIGHMAVTMKFDSLTTNTLTVAACNSGGMDVVFNELPDAKQHLLEYLMNDEGYVHIDNEFFDMWICG